VVYRNTLTKATGFKAKTIHQLLEADPKNGGFKCGEDNSSFYHLYELRFDKLKIDRRFVQELVTASESEIFVRAIIGLCKGLKLAGTAEGVETETQAAAALQHGAQHSQGFLFGKALPAAEVLQLLSAPKPTQLVA
jgi:EAL domain-containing protein (putative c-di-GMP-specific phosphodiesterase class I)